MPSTTQKVWIEVISHEICWFLDPLKHNWINLGI